MNSGGHSELDEAEDEADAQEEISSSECEIIGIAQQETKADPKAKAKGYWYGWRGSKGAKKRGKRSEASLADREKKNRKVLLDSVVHISFRRNKYRIPSLPQPTGWEEARPGNPASSSAGPDEPAAAPLVRW